MDDCTIRMLHPGELMTLQRFPGDYIVHGNHTEQILHAGKAVNVNAARWLGERLLPCLA